jgi:predicted Zn-dependent protease
MLKRTEVIIAVIALSMLVACAVTGPGGKTSLIIVPTSQEVAIGAGMAEELKVSEKELDDPQWQAYLNEVGQKIVAVCDRRDIEYHFTVIESDQINAFAAPGGYVYFYTGLLREMKNESEMAAVVSHEISHVVARHSVKRLQAALGAATAYELVFGDNSSQVVQAAVGIGLGLVFSGYSRNAEREADQYGIIYQVKAGYDPSGFIGMFEALARLGGGQQSVFEQLASSHPDSRERLANAQKQIDAMGNQATGLTRGETRYQQMLARLPKGK